MLAMVFRLGLVSGIGGGCGDGVRLEARGGGGAGAGTGADEDIVEGVVATGVATGVAGTGMVSLGFGFCILSNRDLRSETDCLSPPRQQPNKSNKQGIRGLGSKGDSTTTMT